MSRFEDSLCVASKSSRVRNLVHVTIQEVIEFLTKWWSVESHQVTEVPPP